MHVLFNMRYVLNDFKDSTIWYVICSEFQRHLYAFIWSQYTKLLVLKIAGKRNVRKCFTQNILEMIRSNLDSIGNLLLFILKLV